LKFDGTRQRRAIRSNRRQIPSHDQDLLRRSGKNWRKTLFVTSALIGCSALPAAAVDPTWLANPGSNDYNAATNWTPATVPTDTAFFGTSGVTNLSFSAPTTTVGGWTFNAGASAYTFTNGNGQTLQFTGAGIVINGGSATIINNGTLQFFAGTAGSASITNNSSSNLIFEGGSTAGSATIATNSGGTSFIFNSASGGTARFILNGTGALDIASLQTGGTTAGSIEGDGSVVLGSKNLTVGGNNLSTTFSGVVQDGGFPPATGGSLTKTGSGTLTLSGANTYTGATTVNAGALAVDGSILSATTVNSGGALGGGGTIFNDVTIKNGGMLAPGNATAGTSLSVQGNLALQSGAQYMAQLTPATSTFTNVTGQATLGDASVGVANGSTITKGTQYTILHADGGVNGTFNPQVRFGTFVGAFSYDADDVFLTFTQSLLAGATGLNVNQQRVANAIDGFFNGGGALPAGFVNLLGLSGAPLANALTQISGETATGSQQTTFNAMNQFMGVMTDPFMDRTGGMSPSQRANGYTDEALGYAASAKKTDAFAMFTKAPPVPAFEQRWSVWAAGFGGSQNTNGNAVVGSNNTTSNIAATAVGADYLLSPDTLLGFALAGGGTSFSVANGGSGRSDLFQIGAYVRHNQGPAYISAALAYGWQDVTTDRTLMLAGVDHLRAEFNANAWSGRLEGGYRFVSPVTFGIGITPYAAAQFVTFDLPSYAEQAISGTSQFALAYNAKDVTDVRSELGLRTDKSFVMPTGVLTLRGRFAWAHDFDPDRSIAATFQSLPGSSFIVNGAAQAADAALTTASIEMKWRNGWSTAASFEGEFSDVTRSYAGKGIVRYVW
jgi:autotransporter-associated beta strand protein